MTISLYHGGVAMASQITFVQVSNIRPLAHILGNFALILVKFHSYNSLLPYLLHMISHQSAGGRSKRTED